MSLTTALQTGANSSRRTRTTFQSRNLASTRHRSPRRSVSFTRYSVAWFCTLNALRSEPWARFQRLSAILTGGGEGVCLIVDFGSASADHLQVAAQALGYIQTLRAQSPLAYVSVSASSFPNGFANLLEQPIYERQLFNVLAGSPGTERLILQ